MRTIWPGMLLLVATAAVNAQRDKIDFARDIQPLLVKRCGSCHAGEKPQAGLAMRAPADLLKGGQNGAAIVPGSSRDSLLVQRVTGFRAPVMPLGQEGLSEREIELLRDWIDGLHPIDAFLGSAPGVTDAAFIRRAYFDLWGLPPSPEAWQQFLDDKRPDKRERLIDHLLADKKNYSEHWISFWNDLLRNDEGVIYHGARQSISAWLLKALEDNLPYDRFAQALLDPRNPGDPAGFLMGVNWRGDVSASQTPPMQAAQNTAQVFLGINLKCNSCHDSFISHWKLKDAYGIASYFSEAGLEIYRCDAATGEKAKPRFLFPKLGGDLDPSASLAERRAAAARLFTSKENGLFARTVVNRIWKRLMGTGLVEPVDEMENRASNPELLDWLAADFVEHQYDLKLLLRRIMTSVAYREPRVRRLTAEQFADAVSSITGEWRYLQPPKPGLAIPSREWRLKSSPLTRALGRPIRDQVYTGRNSEATTLQALELVNGDSLTQVLHRGARRMMGRLKPPPANLFDSGVVRAEKVPVDIDITGAEELRLLIEDSDSYDRSRVIAGWANTELASPAGVMRLCPGECRTVRFKGESPAAALVPGLPSEKVIDLAGKGYTRFRATVGVDESSLQSDISPRVRFFIFTEEPDRTHLVRTAAAEGGQEAGVGGPEALITRLYRYALSRDPSPEERRIAREFLDGTAEGLEDLLWSLFVSPEFQYVH